MKIKVKMTHETEEEIEVEFPLYRIHDLDYGSIYSKITETREISINKSHHYNENSWEITVEPTHLREGARINSEKGFALCTGSYASSEHEFEAALKRMKQFMAEAESL